MAEKEKTRFLTLDGLRGVAALCVVFMHVTLWFAPRELLKGANMAVDFFFVLSGFVIAHAYIDRIRGWSGVIPFLAARARRLYPLILAGYVSGGAYAVFKIYFHTVPIHYGLHDVFGAWLWNLLLIPNFDSDTNDQNIYPLNPVSWSLFFEVVGNIAFCLLLAIGKRRMLYIGSVVIIALSLWYSFHANMLEVGFDRKSFTIGFARIGLSFFVGVLLYEVWKRRYFPKFPPGLSFYVLGALLVGCFVVSGIEIDHGDWWKFLCIFTLLPLIVWSGARHQPSGFIAKLCHFLGDLSYPVYLLHLPVIMIFVGTMKRLPVFHGTSDPVLLTLSVFAAIAASWAVLKLYDEPVRAWLARLNGKAPRRR